MAVCPARAFEVEGGEAMPAVPPGAVLVAPAALFAQFGAGVSPAAIESALGRLGFGRILCLEPWEEALRQAVLANAAGAARRPLISPFCPAVVNLIEMRFPSLIPHVAPFAAPLEAARDTLAGEPLVLVVSCPGQRSALLSGPRPESLRLAAADVLIRALKPLLKPDPAALRPREAGPPAPPADVVAVTGLRGVLQTLEELEDGQLEDMPALELALCEQGCFGSPLFRESAPIARHRWAGGPLGEAAPGARAVRRRAPYLPRAGVRLDPDMSRAIAKLGELEALARRLPGRDCGACGAPSCAALAEDIVLGRATLAFCVHQARP